MSYGTLAGGNVSRLEAIDTHALPVFRRRVWTCASVSANLRELTDASASSHREHSHRGGLSVVPQPRQILFFNTMARERTTALLMRVPPLFSGIPLVEGASGCASNPGPETPRGRSLQVLRQLLGRPGQGSMPSCNAVIGRQQPTHRARPPGMSGSLQEGQWPGAMIFSMAFSRALAASSISAMLTGPNGIDSRADTLNQFISPLLLLRRRHLYPNERPRLPHDRIPQVWGGPVTTRGRAVIPGAGLPDFAPAA